MNTDPLTSTLRRQLASVERRLGGRPIATAAPVATIDSSDLIDAAQDSTEFELATMNRAWLLRLRRELLGALERLADGRYGVCEDCEATIPPARLRALPTTPTCVPCQEQREVCARTAARAAVTTRALVEDTDEAP